MLASLAAGAAGVKPKPLMANGIKKRLACVVEGVPGGPATGNEKAGHSPGFVMSATSGGGEQRDATQHGRLARLDFGQGLTNHLLGQAGALAALRAYTQRFPHFAVTAATLVDCIADVIVGNTSAKTYVHGRGLDDC